MLGSRFRVGVAVSGATFGCSVITSVDGLVPNDASFDSASFDSSGSDANAMDVKSDVTPGACGAIHGPSMIIVPSLNPAGSYCIDSTEVTEEQYQQFLDAKLPQNSQPSFCSANTSFQPDLSQNQCAQHPFDPTNAPKLPVVCVDWCDAYAYCAWAGKRLCGEIGRDAGAVDIQFANTAVHDQWFNACSAEGKHAYCYGDTYDGKVCNGADRSQDKLLPVGSLAKCLGGYPGIFDMSGNAGEWESACSDAAPDGAVQCTVRGGSISELSGQLTCNQTDIQTRPTASYNLGFRCCGDL